VSALQSLRLHNVQKEQHTMAMCTQCGTPHTHTHTRVCDANAGQVAKGCNHTLLPHLAHTHIQAQTHTHTSTRIHTSINAHATIHTCANTDTYTHTHAHTHRLRRQTVTTLHYCHVLPSCLSKRQTHCSPPCTLSLQLTAFSKHMRRTMQLLLFR
jgi:hypothetical protein